MQLHFFRPWTLQTFQDIYQDLTCLEHFVVCISSCSMILAPVAIPQIFLLVCDWILSCL